VLAAAPPALSKDRLSYTVQLRQGIRLVQVKKSE
jgi:hypothetical protein